MNERARFARRTAIRLMPVKVRFRPIADIPSSGHDWLSNAKGNRMPDIELMTEVNIDISLFTENESIGVISGPVRVRCVPQIGDALNFKIPIRGPVVNNHHLPVIITVIHRHITANSDASVSLILSDITAENKDHALEVAALFVSKHGLHFDPTEL